MPKSSRNKTIEFDVLEGKKYLDRCIEVENLDNNYLPINKTILGDSITCMEKLPQKFIDLAIVDPPYNLSKNFHGNNFKNKNAEEYQKYTREWIEALIPLLKENATVYLCSDWKTSMIISPIIGEYFNVQNRITWQREKGRGSKSNWKNALEDIWFLTLSKEYYFDVSSVKVRRKVIAPYKADGIPKDWSETNLGNFRNTHPSNFWDDITIPFWSMSENTAHPTQKSEKLISKLILASSKPGDIVFDPFLGSGTTSVVAKKLKRNYLGVELNPLYCSWAEYRLDCAEVNKDIQGYSNGIFWERNSNPKRSM